MIPKIIVRGHSFKGAIAYIAHDKDQALTSERVAWSATGNMITKDPEKAAKVMAWTEMNAENLKQGAGVSSAGRKVETGSVYHYILSWAKGEEPSHEHQKVTALSTLEHLGLSEHEYVMSAHDDTDKAHVHLVVNLTHPETGRRAELSYDKTRLQEWALEYEREYGMHCLMREQNAQMRQQLGAKDYYRTQAELHGEQVTRAYYASDTGQAFINALELEGLQLARGRKSFVAVDDTGKVINLARVIEGATTKEIKAKLGDLDTGNLIDADLLSEQLKAKTEELEQTERNLEDEYDPETITKKRDELAEDPLSDMPMWNASGMAAKRQRDNQNSVLQDHDVERTREHNELFGSSTQSAKGHADSRRAKAQEWQQKIDERVQYWREHHKVDEFEQRYKQAQKDYGTVSGFWSRLLMRERFEEAADNLQNREKQLRDIRERLAGDIQAINKNRPWDIERQYEKHGIEHASGEAGEVTGKRDQSRSIVEAAQAKAEVEHQVLKDAAASPDAAKRLQGLVSTKSKSQKPTISQVKEQARQIELEDHYKAVREDYEKLMQREAQSQAEPLSEQEMQARYRELTKEQGTEQNDNLERDNGLENELD